MDNNKFWGILGMAVVGIVLGIGPFSRGHYLMNSGDSENTEYVVEPQTSGLISFRGNDDGPCHNCGSQRCPRFRQESGANPTKCKCGCTKRAHIDSY